MTISNIAKQVTETKTAHLVRYRKHSLETEGVPQYDVKPYFSGNKHHWTLLDLFTASADWKASGFLLSARSMRGSAGALRPPRCRCSLLDSANADAEAGPVPVGNGSAGGRGGREGC